MPQLLVFCLLLLSFTTFGQYQDRIDSGRPAQYFGARTVGNNVFQVQSGLQQNWTDEGSSDTRTPLTWNTLLRFGIHERVELRLVLDHSWIDFGLPGGQRAQVDGFSNSEIGLRVNLYEGADGLAIGAQSQLLLIDQSEIFRRNTLGSNWLLAATRPLTDKLATGANVSAVWSGDNSGEATFTYAYFFTYNLTDDLVPFAEVFGQFNKGATLDYDFGLAYLIGNDLQLDAYFGWTEGLRGKDFFLSGGLSWRLDWRK